MAPVVGSATLIFMSPSLSPPCGRENVTVVAEARRKMDARMVKILMVMLEIVADIEAFT